MNSYSFSSPVKMLFHSEPVGLDEFKLNGWARAGFASFAADFI